jgi:hypothetical protein
MGAMHWFRSLGLGCSVLAAGALGCGDPEGDGSEPRGCDFACSSNEGGEVRVENTIAPDGTSHSLVTAFFFDAQLGRPDYPGFGQGDNGELDCNWVGGTAGEGATENPSPEQIYPFGDASDDIGATATFAAPGRHYVDVGETVSLQEEGKEAIVLQRYEDHLTPFAGGSFHSLVYAPASSVGEIPVERIGGDGAIGEGAGLSVTVSGNAEVPQTEWGFEERGSGLKVPPRPVILASEGNVIDWSQAGAPTASQDIVRGEDLYLTYPVPASAEPDLLGVVAIFQTEPTFEVTHYCLHTHPGRVTIPGAMHEQMPPHGMIVVSNIYHRIDSLDSERRVDLVGVASTSSNYTLVD